jgi:uncharacterized surface protein with fasciclin (FAS1) repeats
MKYLKMIALLLSALFLSCSNANQSGSSDAATTDPATTVGQSNVQDDVSGKDVVKIAVGSKDHTTLVAALKAASYVDALSNAGPFTVFAPSNEAFDKLPKGTLEDLLKPENKDKLRSILEYHVYVGVLKDALLADGMTYGMVSGENITIGNKNGKITVNGANVLASIPATNGIIHVVDAVLLPPPAK